MNKHTKLQLLLPLANENVSFSILQNEIDVIYS
jgi:hypothetical protein